jgi:hypothetical protein
MLSPNSRSRHLPGLWLNVKSRLLTITVLCRCSPTATTKTSNQRTLHTRTSRGTRNGKLEVCRVCSLSLDLSLTQNLLTVVTEATFNEVPGCPAFTFSWTIGVNAQSEPEGSVVGTATANLKGEEHFTIYKDNGRELVTLQNDGYQCFSIYLCQKSS